jgi:hypothetical protein
MPNAPDALPCPLMASRGIPLPVPSRLRTTLLAATAAALLALAPSAHADDHDPKRAGHPVRIAAYVLHPIGVMLDFLIVRPAHWVVEREPFRTLFGHED